ncbi:MAG: cupin domain-containing protein [Burkholderiaceae bacterium]
MSTPKRSSATKAAALRRNGQATDAKVGARIRKLRHERKMSLHMLADRTSLSIGFISQIERGISSPSLGALTSLADALDVSLSRLFEPAPAGGSQGEIVVRTASRGKLTAWRSGIYKQLLTADTPSRFSFFLMTMEPGATSGTELYAHKGEEAGLVVQGRLRLTVDDRTWSLSRGDSFHFTSDRPHRFQNASRGTTVVAMLNLRGGEPGS